MTRRKLLGRLGWRGQCSCCNGPRDKGQVRAEEKRELRADAIDWESEAGIWGDETRAFVEECSPAGSEAIDR